MEFFKKNIGFSTGALAKGDFQHALDILIDNQINVVEISTLREKELVKFIEVVDSIDLSKFNYISFHAPSKITELSEDDLIGYLEIIMKIGWNIILHPDIISNYSKWKKFGSRLCIENMDKRKPAGRDLSELDYIFEQLPEASMCFDIAHAKQIDPTMTISYNILNKYHSKIKQFHVSSLSSESKHVPLNFGSIYSYAKYSKFFKKSIPIILESVISEDRNRINRELIRASMIRNNKFAVKNKMTNSFDTLKTMQNFIDAKLNSNSII